MKRIARYCYRSVLARLPLRLRRAIMFLRAHGWLPSIRRPATFNEKVNWRIVNDRRPMIGTACDKLATKQLAADGLRCPETLWCGTDISELASMSLPERWVLKPNHASGKVYFGEGKPDVAELRSITAGWIDPAADEALAGHWGYSQARCLLLVEEMLGSGAGAPDDFKFYVFGGRVGYVEMFTQRFDGMRLRLYSAAWQPLDVQDQDIPLADPIDRPANYERMIAFAEQLGAAWDFVRVDLYNIDGEIYLGELTPYPSGGFIRYEPISFDVELGALWELPDLSPTRVNSRLALWSVVIASPLKDVLELTAA